MILDTGGDHVLNLRHLAMSALAIIALSASVFGGAVKHSSDTTTNTTSTSTSTSAETSDLTVNEGTFNLGYVINSYVFNDAHPDLPLYLQYASLAQYPSTMELLTQGPTGYSTSLYMAGSFWSTDAGSAYAASLGFYLPALTYGASISGYLNPDTMGGFVTNPGQLYCNLMGRGTIISTSCPTYVGTEYTALNFGSSTDTVVSQQVTQSSNSSSSSCSVGCFTLATDTTINTDTNTNTDTHTYNYTYTGTGTTDVYDVTSTVSVSPIVLDLSGTGKLDASAGQWKPHFGIKGNSLVKFDLNGNGMDVLMEWVGPKAGLLVMPKADGTVDGSCLFGTTGGFENGFEKLSALDANGDGVLKGDELSGLYVWVDANGNGQVDPGELKSLQEMGITELNLHQRNSKSTFVMNGKTETMWDWWPSAMNIRKVHVASR